MQHHENKTCERCYAIFECKADSITQCQCYTIELSPEEKAYIASNYSDCLCANCLLALKQEATLLYKS